MIDSHAHGWIPAVKADAEEAQITAALALGVRRIVLIDVPGDSLRAAARYPDFVWPVAQIDMDSMKPANLRYWIDCGCRAVKFTMPLEPYSSPRYWALYDVTTDAGVPAIFHSGYLGRYGPKSVLVHMEHTRPAELDWIARNWSGLNIIMAHFGNPWWEEAHKVLWANSNVYADLSGGSAYRREFGEWLKLLAPNGCTSPGVGRLMFASDKTYWQDATRRLPDYIDFYRRLIAELNLPDTVADGIWQGNAVRLFGGKP